MRSSAGSAGARGFRSGDEHASGRPGRAAVRADAALAAAADLVPRVVPAAFRRRVQRLLPRLPDPDGDALGPRGDPGALHDLAPPSAAGPDAGAAADHGVAVAAAAGGPRAPRPPQADAAAVPRRADAR